MIHIYEKTCKTKTNLFGLIELEDDQTLKKGPCIVTILAGPVSKKSINGSLRQVAQLINPNIDTHYDKDRRILGLGFGDYQEKYEKLSYEISGGYKAPCQLFSDLVDDKESTEFKSIKPSYLPKVTFTNLRKCLPEFVIDTLIKGIPMMDKKIKGFANPDAVLTAPETRSSSPVRILRDDIYQTNIRGLYPCGEGAGYAGGIMSAAVDGIKCAESIILL